MSKIKTNVRKQEHLTVENDSFLLEYTKGLYYAVITSERISSFEPRKKLSFRIKDLDILIDILNEFKKELS